MFNIAPNGVITLNRGDNFEYIFKINEGTLLEPVYYTLTVADKLYFGIMEPNQQFENAIVKKVFTSYNNTEDGNVKITLNHLDTAYLRPGLYYYEIKLVKDDTTVNTLITQKFIIV